MLNITPIPSLISYQQPKARPSVNFAKFVAMEPELQDRELSDYQEL